MNMITPNGDGRNDMLSIEGLEEAGSYELMIFTSAGNVVYTTTAYNQDWGAVFEDKPLPPGTYYYTLKVAAFPKPITGFIVINY